MSRGFKPNPKRRTESDILTGQKEPITTEAPRIVMGKQMEVTEVHLTIVEQKVATHTHTRTDIVDFFSTPFWNNIPDKPPDFPPSPHTHSLSDILQSGASTNQVPKWSGTQWQPGSVNWDEITNRPSQFPPSPHTHVKADITDFAHTHTLSELQQSGATTNQVPKWSGTQWQPGNVDWNEVTNKPTQFTPSAHQATHQAGGSDALTGNLDANARVGVMQGGTLVGTRRRINFLAGSNVTISATDDATNEKVDVTINAQGGGELFCVATAPPQSIPAGGSFILARITVPTAKPNLKVVAVMVSPFYGTGALGNAQISLVNETDNVVVATWGSGAGPVYLEPNAVYNLGGKTVRFEISHGAPGAQECWGSVSFKLMP